MKYWIKTLSLLGAIYCIALAVSQEGVQFWWALSGGILIGIFNWDE